MSVIIRLWEIKSKNCMGIIVNRVQDQSQRETIGFIYNRFDLWDAVDHYDLWCCEEDCNKQYFEVCFWKGGTEAWVGLYLVPVTFAAASEIVRILFKTYPQVKMIKYISALNALGDYWTHCDRIFIFPHTAEELDLRLSKKSRDRLKQQRRQLYRDYENVKFEHYGADTEEGIDIAREFINLKRCTHGTVYRITPLEYIKKFHVTDTYCIRVNGETASLILSCEQCRILYMDNISYSRKYAKYSPGMLLYNYYLKEMLHSKRHMFLADGEYEYKDKYDTIKFPVYNGTIYKNRLWRLKIKEIPQLRNKLYKACSGKFRNVWWYEALRYIKHKL